MTRAMFAPGAALGLASNPVAQGQGLESTLLLAMPLPPKQRVQSPQPPAQQRTEPESGQEYWKSNAEWAAASQILVTHAAGQAIRTEKTPVQQGSRRVALASHACMCMQGRDTHAPPTAQTLPGSAGLHLPGWAGWSGMGRGLQLG